MITHSFWLKLINGIVPFLLLHSLTFGLSAQSLLYKVNGENLTYPIYIYGTIHALPQSDFFIDDGVMEIFSLAEKVVLEIDMANPTVVAEAQSAIMMQGNSIDNLMSEDDYNHLKQFFADSLHIPLEMIKQIKPLLMASFVLPKIIGEDLASYEGFFTQLAIEWGKPMEGLETVAEQIEYIDKVPLDQQTKMLLESIYDFEKSRVEFKALVDTYKTRDIEKVYALLLESSEQYKEFGKYLIDERNTNWIPRIIEIGNSQVTFIAVGCGHLGGENGLINLLRKQGYRVEMVKVTN